MQIAASLLSFFFFFPFPGFYSTLTSFSVSLSLPPPHLNSALNLSLSLLFPLSTISFVFLSSLSLPSSSPPLTHRQCERLGGLRALLSWLAAQTTCWFGLLICNKKTSPVCGLRRVYGPLAEFRESFCGCLWRSEDGRGAGWKIKVGGAGGGRLTEIDWRQQTESGSVILWMNMFVNGLQPASVFTSRLYDLSLLFQPFSSKLW